MRVFVRERQNSGQATAVLVCVHACQKAGARCRRVLVPCPSGLQGCGEVKTGLGSVPAHVPAACSEVCAFGACVVASTLDICDRCGRGSQEECGRPRLGACLVSLCTTRGCDGRRGRAARPRHKHSSVLCVCSRAGRAAAVDG